MKSLIELSQKTQSRRALITIVVLAVIVITGFLVTHQPPDVSGGTRQVQFAEASGMALQVTNRAGMVMRLLPPGTYMRGSPRSEAERTNYEFYHEVDVERPFYCSVTEITQEQYEKVMGNNPSFFSDSGGYPVEQVGWETALIFCNKLSELENLEPAYEKDGNVWRCFPERAGYRIPVEIEWEYAYRADSTGAYYSGPNDDERTAHKSLDWIAWYKANAKGFSHPVAQKLPNAWGLYDMSGNLFEWCWDYYNAYPIENVKFLGPTEGSKGRAIRGGCWFSHPPECRAAARRGHDPLELRNIVGFRCVRTAVPGS